MSKIAEVFGATVHYLVTGDAFCVGHPYAIYQGFGNKKILGHASAEICNLFSDNAAEGICTKREIMQMMQSYPCRKRKA